MTENEAVGNFYEALSSITPRDFEDFVAELWERLGWQTATTVASGDDGIDVIATRDEPYRQKKLIQAKQRSGQLFRRHVQQYSYLHHKQNVDEVLLVTTSGFSDGAHESAKEANVKLVGPDTIISLVNEADANDILERYATSDINLRSQKANKSNEGMNDKQPITEGERIRFTELAETNDVYSILTQSIPSGHPVSPAAKLAIAFQLFRGDDPFHVLLITEAGDRATEVLDEVLDLAEPSTYVNCSTATEGGLIGKYNSGGRTHRGVLTECPNGVVALDRIGQLSGKDTPIEPLEQQRVTATEADHHNEYEANFSCLATSTVKYGKVDEYESLDEQISLQPAVFEVFDAKTWLNTDRGEITLPHGFTGLESSKIETLSISDLTAYIAYSIRKFPNPQMTDEAQTKAEEIIQRWNEADVIDVNISTRRSLHASAQASARMRLSDTVTAEDVEVASQTLSPLVISEELIPFDTDTVGTGIVDDDRDKIKEMKRIITDIQDETSNGAPIENVLDSAVNAGIEREMAKNLIERFRAHGEVYEPEEDHLRTI